MHTLNELLRDPRLSGPGLLLLDYDGTLAPFAAERNEAHPYPGVREILERLPTSGPGRFVVVSGRTCLEVGRLLGLSRVYEVWGCHGAQRQRPGEAPRTMTPTPVQQTALKRARAVALQAFPTADLEDKPTSLALHLRRLEPAEAQRQTERVSPAWAELAHTGQLELHAFDGGLELRLPGLHKGLAVRTLAEEEPGVAQVYLGDDLTDEDAFKALGPSGLGVLVRPELRATAAHYWIRPPEEMLRFLEFWEELHAESGKSPGGTG